MNIRALSNWGPVESFISAAGCGETELEKAIDRVGVKVASDIAIEELKARWTRSSLDEKVYIEFTFRHNSCNEIRTLEVRGDHLSVSGDDEAPPIDAHMAVDIVDLLQNLYGTSENRKLTSLEVNRPKPAETRDLEIDSDGARQVFKRLERIGLAVAAVFSTCQDDPVRLDRSAIDFSSDKSICTPWVTQHYENHFNDLRNQAVRLLEIGIGGYEYEGLGGDSLRTWQRYFRRGIIYGLDINEKTGISGPRLRTIQGDQGDSKFLEELGGELGPFDIIIDDGSHLNEHVRNSFLHLFPYVRPGGFYVIEDLQTSYFPSYGGNSTDLCDSNTSVGMLKGLIDGLHHEVICDSPSISDSYVNKHVSGLHVYSTMAIIGKSAGVRPMIPFL